MREMRKDDGKGPGPMRKPRPRQLSMHSVDNELSAKPRWFDIPDVLPDAPCEVRNCYCCWHADINPDEPIEILETALCCREREDGPVVLRTEALRCPWFEWDPSMCENCPDRAEGGGGTA